jgi:hypothetical protein
MNTADSIRAELRQAEADLADVRQRMDGYLAAHGKMPKEIAEAFAAELESAHSRVWALKAKLRTPPPR